MGETRATAGVSARLTATASHHREGRKSTAKNGELGALQPQKIGQTDVSYRP